MNSRQHKFLSIAIVCVLLASAIGVVYAYANDHRSDSPETIQTKMVGSDSFGNCIMDIDCDRLYELGYKVGDYVILSWNGKSIRALITQNYRGTMNFEEFLNINNNGSIVVGCYCAKSPIHVGDVLTMEYHGKSNRAETMPCYVMSKWVQSEGQTDEELMNYRSISFGDIAENRLYRSTNPFPQNKDQFSDKMNAILARHEADYIVDLYESMEAINNHRIAGTIDEDNAEWYLDNDRVFAGNNSILILQSLDYADVFEYIADNEGSYLISCHLGKDRTGFVMIVLEALMGATYEEIYADYSYSFVCLYGTKIGSQEYQLYKNMLNPILACLHDHYLVDHLEEADFSKIDVTKYDLRADAENYLKNFLGLSDETVNKIRHNLSAEAD